MLHNSEAMPTVCLFVCIYLSNHLMLNLHNLTLNNSQQLNNSLSLSLNTCLTLLLAKVYTFHSYAIRLSHREIVAKAVLLTI